MKLPSMVVQGLRNVLSKSVFHPGSWIGWALVLIGAWAVMHLLGWRLDTAVISGTVDPARGNPQWVMLRGTLYAMAYFGALVVSPILLLASGLYVGTVALLRRPGHVRNAAR